MSIDMTNTTPGTTDEQAARQPPEGPATDSNRKTRAAARYGQMTDEEREQIDAQFDGRVRDEAYAQAWCAAVDALWESVERPAFSTEQSATGAPPDAPADGPHGAPEGAPSLESILRSFMNAQSEETKRCIADALLALLSRPARPEGASSAATSAKPTSGDVGGSAAKDKPLDLKPIYDAIVFYVAECITDGSARKYVTGVVGEMIGEAMRTALDERGLGDEDGRRGDLYDAVVALVQSASTPAERLMWARFARRLQQDGRPGFVERMVVGWWGYRERHEERVSYALRDVVERAQHLYRSHREEEARRAAEIRHLELIEGGKNLTLILNGFREIATLVLSHSALIHGPATGASASAQATTGKPPASFS